jgi:peptidoglycan/LPS O-acetylase OafA/YrhL
VSETSPGVSAPPAAPHLPAVDVVRFLTVLGVIVVHSTSLTNEAGSDATGGVLVVLHVTREVFLFLSAFVLAYSYRDRPQAAGAFWRRRYPLVVVPYAAWSVAYVLTGGHLGSPAHVMETIAVDLTDGGAHFHLYFLLLTLQLYLVFPALLHLLDRGRHLHVPLLVASAAFQLAFGAAVQFGWRPPVLGEWIGHAGSWLPSYELYVVAGVIAALHFDAVTGWVRRHGRVVAGAFAASVGLGVASYLVDLTLLGYGPLRASEVFQPVIVVEAAAALLAQYALGLWAVDRLSGRRLDQLRRSSDVSFGVYLAHPLIIAGILDAASTLGVSSAVGRLPSGLVEAMVVVGLVPAVYALSFLLVAHARRSRFSLAVAGRRRLVDPVPVPVPVPVRSVVKPDRPIVNPRPPVAILASS